MRKEQKCCCTDHSKLHQRELQSNRAKEFTQLKKDCKQIYEYWIDSGIPLYKLTAYDQYRIKFHILNESHLPSKAEQRQNGNLRDKKYRLRHYDSYKKRSNARQRYRRKIILGLAFAKFWDMVENG